jgi:nuclear pore complex protein Nup188
MPALWQMEVIHVGSLRTIITSVKRVECGLTFGFIQLLETFLAAEDVIDATTGGTANRDLVADIIGMFAGLLLGYFKAAEANPDTAAEMKEDALGHLETASSGMGRNRDIVTVIFDIFEEELQRQSTTFGSDVSLDVLVR